MWYVIYFFGIILFIVYDAVIGFHPWKFGAAEGSEIPVIFPAIVWFIMAPIYIVYVLFAFLSALKERRIARGREMEKLLRDYDNLMEEMRSNNVR